MINKYLKEKNRKVFIIAEAGINHNGKILDAYKLIDIAKESGADAVKFQTWKKGEITGKFTENVDYINKNISNNKLSRYDLSEKLRLKYSEFKKLKKYADSKNIMFLTTPDGFDSLEFCVKKLKIKAVKIGSSELNHIDFLKKAASCKRDIILSTGMGNLKEVTDAVRAISKINKKNNLFVLQCTSEYPAPLNSININAMLEMKKKFKVDVGLSDHSIGYLASILACANGAKIIEKHFTINKKMFGPDHKSSLNPSELKKFVKYLRDIPVIMGSKYKKPNKNELKYLKNIRRGIVAKKNIKKGTILNKSMLIYKRPFLEIEPNKINKLIGKKINVSLKEDQPIKWKYIDE